MKLLWLCHYSLEHLRGKIALDLELPPGFLAAVGGPIGMQNARILQMLLAKHGGIQIDHHDTRGKNPLVLRDGADGGGGGP